MNKRHTCNNRQCNESACLSVSRFGRIPILLVGHQLDFERHSRLFIQIINRSPNDGGSHWLTISNINCLENTVKVYDSAYRGLPQEEEMIVASLVSITCNELWVIFPNVALQTNEYNCGLYAIANATALAHGIDPKTQIFIPRLMREHLYKCIEEKHLGPFPVTISQSRRNPIKKDVELPLSHAWHADNVYILWHLWKWISPSVCRYLSFYYWHNRVYMPKMHRREIIKKVYFIIKIQLCFILCSILLFLRFLHCPRISEVGVLTVGIIWIRNRIWIKYSFPFCFKCSILCSLFRSMLFVMFVPFLHDFIFHSVLFHVPFHVPFWILVTSGVIIKAESKDRKSGPKIGSKFRQ